MAASRTGAPYIDLPTDYPDPFSPPATLTAWRADDPMRRVEFHAGHSGWLVTGYELAKTVLLDNRFSIRVENAFTSGAQPLHEMSAPGVFARIDLPDHARLRRLVADEFTPRRIDSLVHAMTDIIRHQLSVMAGSPRPVNFVEVFCQPTPALIICDLLGIPSGERSDFHGLAATVLDKRLASDKRMEAAFQVFGYILELLKRKQSRPEDDLTSRLAARRDVSPEEATGVISALLIAGHVITANMLALGTFDLLAEPDQLDSRCSEKTNNDDAVDSLLRFLTFAAQPRIRVALADVKVGGRTIRRGEMVAVSLGTANRDPAKFPDPDRLDLSKPATGHLAFGWGIHRCLGQQLGRAELRISFVELFRRFPSLRLAVPVASVERVSNDTVHGVSNLPLTW